MECYGWKWCRLSSGVGNKYHVPANANAHLRLCGGEQVEDDPSGQCRAPYVVITRENVDRIRYELRSAARLRRARIECGARELLAIVNARVTGTCGTVDLQIVSDPVPSLVPLALRW